jgi:hypothetical protein
MLYFGRFWMQSYILVDLNTQMQGFIGIPAFHQEARLNGMDKLVHQKMYITFFFETTRLLILPFHGSWAAQNFFQGIHYSIAAYNDWKKNYKDVKWHWNVNFPHFRSPSYVFHFTKHLHTLKRDQWCWLWIEAEVLIQFLMFLSTCMVPMYTYMYAVSSHKMVTATYCRLWKNVIVKKDTKRWLVTLRSYPEKCMSCLAAWVSRLHTNSLRGCNAVGRWINCLWKFSSGIDVMITIFYDFWQFLTIFGKKFGVFLKNQCYDHFFYKKLVCFQSKTPLFSPNFSAKIFKKS